MQVYELLGAEALLHFEYAAAGWLPAIHSRTKTREGDTVRLALDLEKAYLFDKETQQAVI